MALSGQLSVTNYMDTNAVPGQLYFYRVQTIGTAGPGALSGSAGGYALLVANLADTKSWKLKDSTVETLTGKKIVVPLADAFQAGWNYIAIKNVETGALVDTPHLLLTTDKKRMKWSYKGVDAQVVYKESRNRKTGAVKGVLVYKYNGDMPRTIGIYYAPAP